MSIFGAMFSKKVRLHPNDFDVFTEKLCIKLEAHREQFVFGILSGLKGMGVSVENISPHLVSGSELDSALKGFQLTCFIGFTFNYIPIESAIDFDKNVTGRLDCGDGYHIEKYRERYLDCEGNISAICGHLAEDVYELWERPVPKDDFLNMLYNGARTLGTLSQVAVAQLCGDKKTENKLMQSFGI